MPRAGRVQINAVRKQKNSGAITIRLVNSSGAVLEVYYVRVT